MKIAVLNGSPKGNYSITLQSSLYLAKLYKEDEFEVMNVGNKLKSLEKDITHSKHYSRNQTWCFFPTLFTHSLLLIRCTKPLN